VSNESLARTVVVESAGEKFQNQVTIGPFQLVGDQPREYGGDDAGPNPYDFLLASLGTCTSMMIVGNARLRNIPLKGVRVTLHHASIHAVDCEECHTRKGTIDRLTREIELIGDLSEEQRQTLLELAKVCPVSQTLTHEINIQTVLSPQIAAAAS
jgi:putative redox protein